MEAIKLFVVFGVIVMMVRLRRPLAVCILAGGVSACLLFQIGLTQTFQIHYISQQLGNRISPSGFLPCDFFAAHDGEEGRPDSC